jgi:diguanylate cyclase
VTESALVDLAASTAALNRLRALGVRLALDDFGTGYSALSYLARLPFDVVKIDREFIGSLGEDRRVEALLAGIVGLCRSLQLGICAEGIETEAQLESVRRLGCQAAQGFLFAPPLPADSFAALLVQDPPDPRSRRASVTARRALRPGSVAAPTLLATPS